MTSNTLHSAFLNNWYFYLGVTILIELMLIGLFSLNKILPFALAALIVLTIIFFYSLIIKPYLWLLLMVIGSFLDNWGQISGGITVFHISWASSLLAWVIYYLFNHNTSFKFFLPISKYFFLYIAVAALSLIYSPNLLSGISYLSTSIALYILTIWIVNFLKSEKEYNWLAITLLIGNVFITGLIIYQILTFDPWKIIDATVSETGEKILRPAGTFADPNVAAAYIVVGLIYGITVFLHSKPNAWFKLFLSVTIIISFVGIILTFSRTVWVSLTFGLLTLLFYQSKRNILIFITTITIFFLIFIFLTPYGSFITARVSSIFDFMGDVSIRTRLSLVISGINMYIDHPVFGIGFRAFPLYYDYYIDPLAPQVLLYVKESHTLFVTLLAELGIVGVLIFFFWFKRFFVDIIASIRKTSNPIFSAFLIGSLANFVTFNVNSLFYGNMFPHFNFLWLIFGIVYSIYFIEQYKSKLIK